MSKTWILLKAQLINFFPVNEIKEPSNKKQNSVIIIGLGIITLVLFLCFYNVLTAQTLVQVEKQDLIPPYMVSVSSFAILFMTIFYSNGILFGSRDMDMLSSLPVKASEIMSSKFMFMYLLNFLIAFIFMIPGGVVWVLNVEANILSIISYFMSVFFVPFIPMSLASFIGVIIVYASSRFRNRNIFSLVFSFIAIGLVGYIGVSSMQTTNDMGNIGTMLAKQITGLYPLSYLFLRNVGLPVSGGIGMFLILSIITFFLFVKVTSSKYGLLNSLSKTTSRYEQRKGTINRQSPFVALYQKELGRFFSSYMAVLNTGLGVILLCVFSVFFITMSLQQVGVSTGIEDINSFLADFAPIVIVSMLSLSCPASSAISLEGKNVWILQSSPISMKMILNSKLAVNFTLHAFGYLFAVLSFIIKIEINVLQFLGLLTIPICYSIFISVLGIFLNKKYPNYKWDNEMIVVKQSIPAIVSGTIGMLVVLLPILLYWFLSFPLLPTLWSIALILLIISYGMYQQACKSNYI